MAVIRTLITIVGVVSATTVFQSTGRPSSKTLPHYYVGVQYTYNTRYTLVLVYIMQFLPPGRKIVQNRCGTTISRLLLTPIFVKMPIHYEDFKRFYNKPPISNNNPYKYNKLYQRYSYIF